MEDYKESYFINQFGVQELERFYIEAKRRLPYLEDMYKEFVESLYDESPLVRVHYDYETGKMCFTSGNIEDYVLNMIERKELYLKEIERLKQRVSLLEEAMETLRQQEKGVIQQHYFKPFRKSPDRKVLAAAQDKLCSYIGKACKAERNVAAVEQKADRLRRVQEYKGII